MKKHWSFGMRFIILEQSKLKLEECTQDDGACSVIYTIITYGDVAEEWNDPKRVFIYNQRRVWLLPWSNL